MSPLIPHSLYCWSLVSLNWTAHYGSSRCPQVYKVYGSDGAAPNFDPSPKIGTDPRSKGWEWIATVDTRPPGAEPMGGQDAVRIAAPGAAGAPGTPDGVIGRYRYLSFVTFVTEADDPFVVIAYCADSSGDVRGV